MFMQDHYGITAASFPDTYVTFAVVSVAEHWIILLVLSSLQLQRFHVLQDCDVSVVLRSFPPT